MTRPACADHLHAQRDGVHQPRGARGAIRTSVGDGCSSARWASLEHRAWQLLTERTGGVLRVGRWTIAASWTWRRARLIWAHELVSIVHLSNALGTISPVDGSCGWPAARPCSSTDRRPRITRPPTCNARSVSTSSPDTRSTARRGSVCGRSGARRDAAVPRRQRLRTVTFEGTWNDRVQVRGRHAEHRRRHRSAPRLISCAASASTRLARRKRPCSDARRPRLRPRCHIVGTARLGECDFVRHGGVHRDIGDRRSRGIAIRTGHLRAAGHGSLRHPRHGARVVRDVRSRKWTPRGGYQACENRVERWDCFHF